MAHQSGLGPGMGPGGTGYSFDPRHPSDAHLQPHMQSPHPEHFPPTSPIFTGPPSLAGSVTPSCTTPPMGTTSLPRYPLRSPTMFHGDQHHATPVSPSRNVMDPNMQLQYSYPYYRGRRHSYSEESPITSSPGGTPHLPGYAGGVMPQAMPNVPSYQSPTMTKCSQPGKSSRRNPGLRIDFTPMKGGDGGPDGQPSSATPYQSPALRSPAYQNLTIPGGPLQVNISDEVKELRRKVAEYFYQNIELIKKRYHHNLQELFFLQRGGSIIDFPMWKRRPTPQWLTFHASHKLEDDVDFLPPTTPLGPDQIHNVGNVDYIALQHKFYSGNPSAGNMQQVFGNIASPSVPPFGNLSNSQNPYGSSPASNNPAEAQIDLSSSKLLLSKDTGFSQGFTGPSKRHNAATSSSLSSLSDGQSLVFHEVSHSKEDIMLEARKEAEILKRISELRKEGLWSSKRLPKVQEPSRNKAHWDYVLEEMAWLATDFAQERRWKKGVAKKLSRAVLKYHQDIKAKEVKAEKESTVRLQKIASSIAKEVRQFWINIEKVVHYKVQSRMEEKRKKALDIHLNFIVGQTEKYSSWLAESLKESKPAGSMSSSVASSTAASSPTSSYQDTGEESDFNMQDDSDDEETLDVEEAYEHKEFKDPEEEIKALQRESEIPIDDLLESLPLEMFTEPKSDSDEDESAEDDDEEDQGVGAGGNEFSKEVKSEATGQEEKPRKASEGTQSTSKERVEKEIMAESANNGQDDEFVIRDTMVDVDDEGTLEEEEKLEEKEDHAQEISELEAEGELPIEELLKKYNVGNDEDEVQVNEESNPSSDEEESSEEEEEGMEFLLQSDTSQGPQTTTDVHSESPNQELTDAAATAESLQPTGYTLETTKVKTPIPFLLRGGTLREYQYIGLDWLVTMYEKCLNGILADEMGLGKTIMTIAVLAHLACEKGSWGPHLIVVPTSVMLNWEMEFKKWCPGFKILTYYGNQKERKLKRTGWTKPNAFHVCITSYKLVVQDHQAFRRKKWKYLILDEAQNIKNFKSQRWQYLLNFNTQHRLLLTGTPLQNNLMELWSLMHFLMPHLFESHKDFKEWFSNPLSGMIEGSSEYNENLIKRLHKILRPFLLRRLKSEVEKQMPQKYEHIIRCRLSKRQRVLYDDFMSQTRTKETLESGHLLSVINILMQLRKVCNHPDLFEPRLTVTSLKMDGLLYCTASLVLTALERNPLDTINLTTMNLILTHLEYNLSAFAGHRVKQLQTPQPFITEVDTYPTLQTPFLYPVVKTELGTNSHNHMANEHLLNHTAKAGGSLYYLRNSTVPWHGTQAGDACYSDGLSNVHLLADSEKLFPGYGGQGYTPPGEQDYYNALNSAARNSGSYFSSDGGSALGKPLSHVPDEIRSTSTVSYNSRILPKFSKTLNATELRTLGAANGHVPLKDLSVLEQKKLSMGKPTDVPQAKGPSTSSSPFALASLKEKQCLARQHKLRFLAAVNERRCAAQPVYGQDLVHSVTLFRNPLERRWYKASQSRPAVCETLQLMTKSPQERVDEMKEVINRFVFTVPAVTSQPITMHTSHPPPSYLVRQRQFEETLQSELSSKMDLLHPIIRGQLLQFPEVRLIQYDCGKLQTLDHLLRRLKAERHRVLIFTQMTKMLDVLERFLNYHGYLYLRLDGTTRVEQRQVLMERFNNDTKIFCFILSTRSGGVGVNLTGADTVIFYDSDWNPTMDAQAQDRCHRIGQTQDVHIYRLISEKTIEENILKKAHQKKLLGDIAIEGGNFTTTVLKETTVRELFSVDAESDLQEMVVDDKPEEEVTGKKNVKSQNAFEQALMKAEDEQDVKAASLLKAEQDAELDEFDENIPLDDENSATTQGISKVEEELRELESQLSSVERYAVHFVESSYSFVTAEQLDLDEKKVELAKKDWELEHIQAIKEEEERRAAEEEDEILYVTYPSEESRQVKKSKSKSKPSNKKVKGGNSGTKKRQTRPSAGSQGTSSAVPRPSRTTRRTSSADGSKSASGN